MGARAAGRRALRTCRVWRSMDPGATLDDLNEAVTTLEDARRIALRVFGGAHPVTGGLGRDLCKARFTLSIRGETDGETPSLWST